MRYEEYKRNDFDINSELLISEGVVTRKELMLVCMINGYNEKTLNDILYARTGYNDILSWCEDNDIIY